ncbi:MAG TPA: CHAD domain-containing protein [Roseateles sp.]
MPLAEVELRFLVPAASRAAISAEFAHRHAAQEPVSLVSIYLDTPDHRLAHAGLSWWLRSEGGQWFQTLEAGGAHASERREQVAVRPDATPEAAAHAGTRAGRRLAKVLRRARADGLDTSARFTIALRRASCQVQAPGAAFEVVFEEGELTAGPASLGLCELGFKRIFGSAAAMQALAESWRRRFALIHEPRTRLQRGQLLADGVRFPPVRVASHLSYPHRATPDQAMAAVVQDCLAQVTLNAIGLSEGDPGQRVERVHQLRIGVRRLRCALRSFAGWTPVPPAELVEGLQALFTKLGKWRESDVLLESIAGALDDAGAPRLVLGTPAPDGDIAQTIRSAAVQRTLLGWMAWSISRQDEAAMNAPLPSATDVSPGLDSREFRRRADRRLRRCHRRMAAGCRSFDDLDLAALHALRKRIKRQRYAVEFFTPLLRRRGVRRYLRLLAAVQDRLGELNDLAAAKTRLGKLVKTMPEAWFALGWIAARIAEVRAQLKLECRRFANADVPQARH